MRKHTYLFMAVMGLIDLFMWTLNKILTALYLCLPIGLFFLLMQLREKNNKGNAIGAFIDENSEFQYIFPEYILVSNKPNKMKTEYKAKMTRLNNFLDKWKWTVIAILMVVLVLVILLKVS